MHIKRRNNDIFIIFSKVKPLKMEISTNNKLPDISFVSGVLDMIAYGIKHLPSGRYISCIENLLKEKMISHELDKFLL